MALRPLVLVASLVCTSAQRCLPSDETCRTSSDIDEAASSSMIQSRRARHIGQSTDATVVREDVEGETVHVSCDPQCHSVEKFSLTVASPRHGNATFELVANRNLVAEDHHIMVELEDGSVVNKKMPEHLLSCHYYGDMIVLSTCNGWRATIMRPFDDLYLTQKADGTFALGVTRPPEEHSDGFSLLELEDYVPLAGVCGDGVINAGEDCDGGDCCTDGCKFKEKGESCDGGPIDYCMAGDGKCSGVNSMCYVPSLPDGTPCPDGGFCYDGTCASRDRQCENVGWNFGSCGEQDCVHLKCLSANGTCVVAGDDYSVMAGSPCGKSNLCAHGKCIAVDLPEKVARVLPSSQPKPPDAAHMLAPTANLVFVITGAAQRAGWSAAKIPALVNYANGFYQNQLGLVIRAGRTLTAGTPQVLDPATELSKGMDWVAQARRKGQIPGTMGPASFMSATVRSCRSPGGFGMAGVGCACKTNCAGVTQMVAVQEICPLRDRVVTHELGHNVGMVHLNANIPGDWQMQIGFGKQGFHPTSIAAYRKLAREGKTKCFMGGSVTTPGLLDGLGGGGGIFGGGIFGGGLKRNRSSSSR